MMTDLMMTSLIRLFLTSVISVIFLSACVTTPTDFEEPSVSVISFKPKSSNGISPEFEIVVHVTNPNRDPLELEGISYAIKLNGNKVLSGVANDLPTIEPYDEADITLYATADLFGGIQLLTGLMDSQSGQVEYEFNAKLDLGFLRPLVRVSKKGVLSDKMGR